MTKIQFFIRSSAGRFAVATALLVMLAGGAMGVAGSAVAADGDVPVRPIRKKEAGQQPTPGSAKDTWHSRAIVTGRPGLRIIHYWSKKSWMRAETLISGHPIVTIVRDGEYLAFDRLTGKGLRVARSPAARAEDGTRLRPFGNELDEVKAQGAERVETETIGGRRVEIWRVTDGAGRRKLWVMADSPQLPVRLEMFVRGGSETITTEYSTWAVGIEIPDAFFFEPPDIQFERFEYEAYLASPHAQTFGLMLYPDLLHGTPAP